MLATGHEKGSIVVWHNIAQYYLQALAQAQTASNVRAAAPSSEVVTGKEGKEMDKKKSKKHHKQTRDRENTVTAVPVSTTLHWHAHEGEHACFWIFVEAQCVTG